MKRIIVPVDFSEEALEGLNLAITLAGKIPSKIEMVYVKKKSNDIFYITREEESKNAKKEFEKILKNYKSKIPENSEITYIIKEGKIFQEIVNQAHSFEDSFIVSSTHGASGFEKFFIGSNTFKIIAATHKPVFTIRKAACPKEIKNIVLPIDTSIETRQKIPFTAEIADYFGAKVHIVKVTNSDAAEFKRKVELYGKQTIEYIEKYKLPYETDYLTGSNITDLTLEYADKVKADLVSIMTEQSVNISGLIIGGNAQQMLNKAEIPVLTISPKELYHKSFFKTQGY
jgi:nucleotide-binding universal stress UspA family protein